MFLPKSSYVSVVFIYICYFCIFIYTRTKMVNFAAGKFQMFHLNEKKRKKEYGTKMSWDRMQHFFLALNSHYKRYYIPLYRLHYHFLTRFALDFHTVLWLLWDKLINALIFSYMWCIDLEAKTISLSATQSHHAFKQLQNYCFYCRVSNRFLSRVFVFSYISDAFLFLIFFSLMCFCCV